MTPGVVEGVSRVSRSGSENRRRLFQVAVRLLPAEHALLMAETLATGLSPGEILRRAYFGTSEEETRDDEAR